MITQKLYRNGNSVAVTIPKEYLEELNLNENSEVIVEHDPDAKSIIISGKNKKKLVSDSSITPDFLNWLKSFNKEYGPALKELAKR